MLYLELIYFISEIADQHMKHKSSLFEKEQSHSISKIEILNPKQCGSKYLASSNLNFSSQRESLQKYHTQSVPYDELVDTEIASISPSRSNQNTQRQTKPLTKVTYSRRVLTEAVAGIDNPQTNQNVFPYLNPKVRFPKPYLENTKFVDLIYKNKNLLRRGLFDLPLEDRSVIPKSKSLISKGSISSLHNIQHLSMRQQQFIRYSSAVKRQIRKLKQEKMRKKQRNFHTSIQNCSEQYQRLLAESQRNPFWLRNSMHRILAAKTINDSLKNIAPYERKKLRASIQIKHFD